MLQYKIIPGVAVTAALAAITLCAPNTYAADESAAVESAINSLKTAYQAAVDTYNAQNVDNPLHIVDLTDCYGPFYKSSSMNAYTPVANAQCFETQTADNITATVIEESASIISTLTSAGFTAYGPEYYWPPHQQYLNEETGVICSIAQYGANCGHINQQTITNKWAEYLNSIGAAFYTANQEYPVVTEHKSADYASDTVSPIIKNSDYESYQYTTIGIQNAVGLFYRSSPTSDWVYFTSEQGLIDCSEYTGEVQKGFAGFDCYDSAANTNSKVTVSTSTTGGQASDSDSSTLGVPDTGVSTDDDSLAAGTEKVLAAIAGAIVVVALGAVTTRRLQRRHDVRTFSRK